MIGLSPSCWYLQRPRCVPHSGRPTSSSLGLLAMLLCHCDTAVPSETCINQGVGALALSVISSYDAVTSLCISGIDGGGSWRILLLRIVDTVICKWIMMINGDIINGCVSVLDFPGHCWQALVDEYMFGLQQALLLKHRKSLWCFNLLVCSSIMA